MKSGSELLDQYYPEMRWRVLSLAADFDRLQRGAGGEALLQTDARLQALRSCIAELANPDVGRAERMQMIFSDRLPVAD